MVSLKRESSSTLFRVGWLGFLGVAGVLCACGSMDRTVGIQGSVWVSPASIEFAETLVNATSLAQVHVSNPSKISAELQVSLSPPFFMEEALVSVAPGESKTLGVYFRPIASEAFDGVLKLGDLEIRLRGTGVTRNLCEPDACLPSNNPCQTARCDPTLGCVADSLPDGTHCHVGACLPESLLVCEKGQCVERPRPATDRSCPKSQKVWEPAYFPGRHSHAMAFDQKRGSVLVFGGLSNVAGNALSDTWEWNGEQGTWTNLTPSNFHDSPAARGRHTMAYDATTGKIVLFGGSTADVSDFEPGVELNDTWEWDSTLGHWIEVTPALASDSPPARRGHAMAFDATRGKVVVFAGIVGSSHFLQDTWEWDSAGKKWRNVTPSNSSHSPAARANHAMVFDGARGKILLFGGVDGLGRSLSDTWEWNGSVSQWVDLSPANGADSPLPRNMHSMAFDASRGKVILFGGYVLALPNDNWEWDGLLGTWTQVFPSQAPRWPSVWGGHAMAFDASHGTVILVGGFDGEFSLSDTWEWDSSKPQWNLVTPSNVQAAPAARVDHALVFDSARHRMVLFGGGNGYVGESDTWTWDGQQKKWSNVTPSNPQDSPPRRGSHAMAYDIARDRIVLFGGYHGNGTTNGLGIPLALADTWEWDSQTGIWTEVTPLNPANSPRARQQHSMAYDLVLGQVVMFGGQSEHQKLNDTWVWDGAQQQWTNVTPVEAMFSPSARTEHEMSYDVARKKIVLFGGKDSIQRLNDTWEWDSTQMKWFNVTPISSADSPSPRSAHALLFDPLQNQTLLFGGIESSPLVNRIWAWNGIKWVERPSTTAPFVGPGKAAFDSANGQMFYFGASSWMLEL